jgi:hypothetical protein
MAVYERFRAWQLCHELSLAVYRAFRRHLDISLGSLSELSYTLLLARDLQILTQEEWGKLDQLHRNAGGMTWLLYRSMLDKMGTRATTT